MSRSVLLDFIRILSVGTVAGVHILQIKRSPLGEPFGVPGFYFVSIGGVAVTVLLILSGLVLGLKYKKMQISYLSFLKKRCFRLYPSYYLILVIGVILYAVRSIYDLPPNEQLTWSDIPFSLSATYAFVGRWGGSLVPTSWFLGLIVSLYALYPLIAPRFLNRPHSSLFILLIVSLVSRLVLGRFNISFERPLDWFPLCRIFEFAFGIYLARIIHPTFWTLLNGNESVTRVTSYMAALSFPFYLVHSPVLDTVQHLPIPDTLWISLFLLISGIVSVIVLEIDNKVFAPLFRRAY
jgi:peptidoglycan/LPS O-acetylase OafA/YrhL